MHDNNNGQGIHPLTALLLSMIAAAIILLAVQAIAWGVNEARAGSYTGDVNCNHRVDVVDAQLLLQLEDGIATLDDPPGKMVWCWDKGDVNDDGNLNAVDALLILQLDARLIPYFP